MASINDLVKNVVSKSKDLIEGVANETQNAIKTTLKDIFIDEENTHKSYVIDSSNKKQEPEPYDLEAKLKEIVDNYKNSN